MRLLVAGWFSFPEMGATAGDTMARDVVCGWLRDTNVAFDIATAEPFQGGVSWEDTERFDYSHVIFVCGPFGNGQPITSFLQHFTDSRLIGIDLSMLQSLEEWNPFDLLLERDSTRAIRPDLALLAKGNRVPVVGLLLVHHQHEYKHRARHDEVHTMIREFLSNIDAAIVPIDTRLDSNATELGTASQIESLIAKMDVVVTTRLHGMALALKNGVPALAIDPISGGAKVMNQAKALDWPCVFDSDDVDLPNLTSAFEYCLTEQARKQAKWVSQRAILKLDEVKKELLTFLATQG